MKGSRSADLLTKISTVSTSPKWSFKGRRDSPRMLETPGPGTYSGSGPTTPRFRRNPSYGFGTSPRENFRTAAAPGPGQYTPSDVRRGSEKYGFGTSQRQSARHPQNGHSPGPGSYSHREPMGTGPKHALSARRDSVKVPEVPGPGSYLAADSPLAQSQVPKYGFGTSPRNSKSAQTLTPGPGQYSSKPTSLNGPKYTMSPRKELFGLQTPQVQVHTAVPTPHLATEQAAGEGNSVPLLHGHLDDAATELNGPW
eukprot:CAMPEP_0171096098 /NCGR_PEP_ID=MMETSP0766_2-20121228/43556_1 /TAXON_ID=439317 /ORGANISM="Gambierdiscus australes, Strain CAWD 149" /LENGTH=253 /DNA_ID=CAMNT_0011555005 /DNA_START=51 /DNA_END=813 /DNA_ORIENTATION=+